jgi:hypothetical protein
LFYRHLASPQASAVLGIFCLLLLFGGAVCGIIGVCQRSRKRTAAVIGLSINGFLILSWCLLMSASL